MSQCYGAEGEQITRRLEWSMWTLKENLKLLQPPNTPPPHSCLIHLVPLRALWQLSWKNASATEEFKGGMKVSSFCDNLLDALIKFLQSRSFVLSWSAVHGGTCGVYLGRRAAENRHPGYLVGTLGSPANRVCWAQFIYMGLKRLDTALFHCML